MPEADDRHLRRLLGRNGDGRDVATWGARSKREDGEDADDDRYVSASGAFFSASHAARCTAPTE